MNEPSAVRRGYYTIGVNDQGQVNGEVGGCWPTAGEAGAMAGAGQIVVVPLGRDPNLQAHVDRARLEGRARDVCRELLEESDELLTAASDPDVAHSRRVASQIRGDMLQHVVERVQNRLLMRRRDPDPELRWTFTRAELQTALSTIHVKVRPDGPLAGEINAEVMADALILALETKW